MTRATWCRGGDVDLTGVSTRGSGRTGMKTVHTVNMSKFSDKGQRNGHGNCMGDWWGVSREREFLSDGSKST